MTKKAFAWYLELVRTGVNREFAKHITLSYLEALRWDRAQATERHKRVMHDCLMRGGQI